MVLDPHRLPIWLGWRCAFGIGATLGLIVIFFRRWIPESPRWLMIHGRNDEAEKIVAEVERRIDPPAAAITDRRYGTRIRTRTHTPLCEVWDVIVHEHRQRSLLGFVLMLFDTVGRRQMIAVTYALAGILLALTGWLFHAGMLDAHTQTLAWTIIFFVASAAASSAYLTVSEIFPLEIRAFAIAIFYAIGTLAGGVGAPILFGWIIGTGSTTALLIGYLLASALMILGALTEIWIGVPAERRPLEHVASPLSSKGL